MCLKRMILDSRALLFILVCDTTGKKLSQLVPSSSFVNCIFYTYIRKYIFFRIRQVSGKRRDFPSSALFLYNNIIYGLDLDVSSRSRRERNYWPRLDCVRDFIKPI